MSKKITIRSSILNEHFQCGICQGYIIDATTIAECLHSFCKSCIVHFITDIELKCPTCNRTIKDVDSCIKSDAALQRLIYRMVPSLLDSEIDRREKFYQMEAKHEQFLFSKKSVLNLKLFYKRPCMEDKENLSERDQTGTKYIQCVAHTPVRVLTKLLRNKFSIPFNYKIKLSHSGHKLNEDESLMHIFTCFLKQKSDLLEIEYEFLRVKSNEWASSDEARAGRGVPCKRIRLIKKNDHYLKLKEKRASKAKQINFSKLNEESLANKVENSEVSVVQRSNVDVDVDVNVDVAEQPLDLTINK